MTDTTLFLSLQALEIFKENFTFSNSRLSAQAQPPPPPAVRFPAPLSVRLKRVAAAATRGAGRAKRLLPATKGSNQS